MKCSEALELISLSIDGETDARQENMLRFHLNGCADCRRALQFSRALSGAVASLPDFTPSQDLDAAVRSRLSLGDYDASPLKARDSRLVLLRRAAVIIPFAATLIFAARIFIPPVTPVSASGNSEEQYSPIPPSAYTRPVTLTTF